MNGLAMKKHITWRRVFWYGLLAAVGWGLYLLVPPKPRWVLAENEVPVIANAQRIVTAEVDLAEHNAEWFRRDNEDSPIKSFSWHGSVRVRDLMTGREIGHVTGDKDAWSYFQMSSNVQHILCTKNNGAAYDFAVYDLLAGTHWPLNGIDEAGFSPQGTVVHVRPRNGDQLRDTATGRVLAEWPENHGMHYQFAPDDSWALFSGPIEGADPATSRWLLWRRDKGIVSRGTGADISNLQIAPDSRFAVVARNSREHGQYCLEVWDSRRGEVVRVMKPSIRADAQFMLSPDSRLLAVWSDFGETTPLEFFEIANGKLLNSKLVSKISKCAFSPDSRLFSYRAGDFPIIIHVKNVRDPKFDWQREDESVGDSPVWLQSHGSRLLTRVADQLAGGAGFGGGAAFGGGGVAFGGGAGFGGGAAFGGGASSAVRILDGESGRELLHRPAGNLSFDHRIFIQINAGEDVNARGIFGKLRTWLPWMRDKTALNVSVDTLFNRRQLLQRTISYDAAQMPPTLHSPYSDSGTFVLMVSGHDTEIWDLPPSRRWLWIIGPPAALAALPWLWRIARRKRLTPPAAAQTSAPAPGAV